MAAKLSFAQMKAALYGRGEQLFLTYELVLNCCAEKYGVSSLKFHFELVISEGFS